jgi:hypothetical protein
VKDRLGRVTVEGSVQISEDPDEMLHWATVLGGRYVRRPSRRLRPTQ